jgi:hypothetical protein
MNAMKMPGFAAETSLYTARGHYQAGRHAIDAPAHRIIPARPRCKNCPWILRQCEINGWNPPGLCDMCAIGWCYDEPPIPDPFGPPRF